MLSEEYIRDLEMSAHFNRKQEQEVMICPVCGRKIDKWLWRTTCCGAEIVSVENGKEITMEDVRIDMTNQEAIKALQEFALNYGLNGKMIDAFGKAIRALENQPEWISVSDRLPANADITEKEYLVQFANDGIAILNYYDGWNCHVDNDGNYHNENEIENVLFWMELPKPRKVDGDDEN